MNTDLNIIVENTIDDYMINEGLFKDSVILSHYNLSDNHLYANDMKQRRCIPLEITWGKGKIKNFMNPEGKKVKIKNMPPKGSIVFCGSMEGQENNYYGFDRHLKLISFYYNSQSRQLLNSETQEPITVYCFPNDLNPSKNGEQRRNQNGGNTQQQGGGRQNGGNIQQQGGGRQNGGNTQQQGGGRFSNSNNSNYEYQGGNDQNYDYDDYNDSNERSQIINVNEQYPLSKAIERLIQYRYIKNSTRATNLMNELMNIGL